MSFPTVGLLDDFNRADGALGANWTAITGYGSPAISSNRFGGGGAVWSAARFGPDCEAFATVPVTGGNFGVLLRVANPAGSATGYYIEGNASGGYIAIYRINGAPVLLGSRVAVRWAAGDLIGAEAVGSTITAYRKPAAGAWTAVTSQADGTHTAAGFVGAYVDGSARLDDFYGGTRIVPSGPTVWTLNDRGDLVRCTVRDSTGTPVVLHLGSA